jgi:hypothetical protein
MGEASLPGVPAGRLDRHTKLQLLSTGAGLVMLAALGLRLAGHSEPFWGVLLDLAALVMVLPPLARLQRRWKHPSVAVRRHAWLGALVPWLAIAAIVVLPLATATACLAIALLVAWGASRATRTELRSWWDSVPGRGTTLSVAVICKDEADRLARLLDAVRGWADEIVVLDSGSSDGTVELARRYTDRVYVTDWPGYGRQKQRALERCTGEWVLSLDADEVPSTALKHEIDAWLAARTGHDGFKAHWVSVVLGGPVDFGADGRYHTRLLRRAAARFDDAAVHEEAVVTGPVAALESPVFHFTFRDDAHMERKFDEYARLWAGSRHARGRRASAFAAPLRGAISFLLLYLVRLGVLDGWRGLRMAARYARYTRDKYGALAALSRSG